MDYKYITLAEQRASLFQECLAEAPIELRIKLKRVKEMEDELVTVIRSEYKKATSGGLFGGGGLFGLGL